MPFNPKHAQEVASEYCDDQGENQSLVTSFVEICQFLSDDLDRLSWRKSNTPDVATLDGLKALANKFFLGHSKSDFPVLPQTVPDEMVSIVMQTAFGYSNDDCERIKIEHKQAMSAENCVGALLERYLDSVLREHGWHRCYGDFVKAIDFIKKDSSGGWIAVQVKNRDNTENSSSGKIRQGTTIQKWFRTYSKTGKTNWDNLPEAMRGLGLSEAGFTEYVRGYLEKERNRHSA